MKGKKFLIFVNTLVLLALLALVLGCAQEQQPQQTAQGAVTLIDTAGNQLLHTKTTVTSPAPNAEEAVRQACKANTIPFTCQNSLFDGFGGQKSTAEDGWLLYVDGKLAEKGAKEIALTDGFQIEFRYVNYQEAFSEGGIDGLGGGTE